MVGLPVTRADHDLVLLAGGRGRRMGGVVKPLLRGVDGRTLLERALDALPARRAIVVAPEDLHPPLREAAGSATLIADPGAGPAPAILAAARASTASRLLVVAADHPHPSPSLARRLLAAGTSAWVVTSRGPEPLFTVAERAALLHVDPPPRSARDLFAAVGPATVRFEELDWDERRGLEDVDAPEDALRAGLRRGR